MSYIFLGISFVMFLLFMVVFLGVMIYLRQQTATSKTLNDVFEDPDIAREEIQKQTSLCLRAPPCEPGYIQKENTHGDLCCYTDTNDPSAVSTEDKVMDMIQTFGSEFLPDQIKEKIIVHTATKFLERRAVNKLSGQMAKLIAKQSVDLTLKTTSRIIVKQVAKAQTKAMMGPVGWALFVFDMVTMALDMWDPMGYNNWRDNVVFKNIRNKSETLFEETIKNNGDKYPFLAPYMYDTNTITQITHVIFQVSEYLDYQAELSDNMYKERFGDGPVPEVDSPAFLAYIDDLNTAMASKIDAGYFEEFVCRDLKDTGFRVKWIPDLRQCSLDEQGCEEYNKHQESVPEDERMFAMYANEYRERDTRDPGDDDVPKMRSITLSTPACMISPLSENAQVCKNESHGSRWDPNAGMCDFSQNHCDRYGLKRTKLSGMDPHRIHNCEMYPGAEFAEFIFGTTITRSAIRGMQTVEETLYLDKMNEFSKKYLPLYNVNRVIAEHFVLKTADIGTKILMDLGQAAFDTVVMAIRRLSDMGERVVDNVHKIVNNPLVVFEDPRLILDIITKGLEDVVGLIMHITDVLFNVTITITRHIANSFKEVGKRILADLKKIGKTIADLF
jgi:hypothetical protein